MNTQPKEQIEQDYMQHEVQCVTAGKADKTIVTGTDGNDYAVTFGMDNGAPSVICELQQSQTAE